MSQGIVQAFEEEFFYLERHDVQEWNALPYFLDKQGFV